MRLADASWTTMSIGSEASSSRSLPAASSLPMPAGSARSQATSCAEPGDGACADRLGRHSRQRLRQTARSRMGNQRGDERHRQTGGEGRIRNAILIGRANRQRQVAAGAGACRRAGRHDRQRRLHAGLFGARRVDGAAERGAMSRAASALRSRRPRYRLFDRRLDARRCFACRQRQALRTWPPIFVGGTGLYFRALEEGISEMPDIPKPILRALALRTGRERRRQAAPHPDARRPSSRDDAARRRTASIVVRALEVLDGIAAGDPNRDWQAGTRRARPLFDRRQRHLALVIEPDRAELVARIDRRFDGMIDAGALEEVKAIAAPQPRHTTAGHEGDRRARSAALAGEIGACPRRIERAKIATRAVRQAAKST